MISDNTLRVFELFLSIYKIDIGKLSYLDICEYASNKSINLHNTNFFNGLAQDNIWELNNFIEDCKIHQFNKIR